MGESFGKPPVLYNLNNLYMRRNGYMAESSHSTSDRGELNTETETWSERVFQIYLPSFRLSFYS